MIFVRDALRSTPRRALWGVLRGAQIGLVCAVALAISTPAIHAATPAPHTATATAPPRPALEPKALQILKAAGAKLAGAHMLAFTAIELFESSSRQGHPLAYTNKYLVVMQRPDKLRVTITADGPASDFYYSGQTMTAYAAGENFVATAPAPPTIDGALKAAYAAADIYFPFSDVLVTDPYGDMAKSLKLAYYIGQSKVVGDTTTDMVAIAGNGVFEQVWIGTDDQLPRMIRAVFLNDPERLRHELVFSDWQLDQPVAADAFTPVIPADAKHIPFKRPGQRPTAQPSPAPKPH